MTKDKKFNKVTRCFEALAEWQDIPLKFAWKAELVKKIGRQLYIKHSNLIGTWEGRKYIPHDALTRILNLDIPDSVKTLCRNCEKTPTEDLQDAPGSTFGKQPIPDYGCKFQNKQMALEMKYFLLQIERIT